MGTLYTLTRREVTAYFLSPMAYIFLFVFLLLQGFSFMMAVDFSRQYPLPMSPWQFFVGQNVFFWIFLFVMIPSITMRLIAEEKRTGTIEVLMTAPVTDWQMVLSKYLGALLFYLFLWIPTLVYVYYLSRYATPDHGEIAASFLGVAMLGAVIIPIGLFCSSMTDSQITAAILSAAGIIGYFLLGMLPNFDLVKQHEVIKWTVFGRPIEFKLAALLKYLSPFETLGDYTGGYVDGRHLVLAFSVILFFLYSTVKVVESRRWK